MNNIMKKVSFVEKPVGIPYEKCREYLRKSFKFSCAYCTITESESPGATFNIDHYRPVTYFPLLRDECDNLRYSCPRCNSYKRDNWISVQDGCIRDCKMCQTKKCADDIFRFINCIVEDPQNMVSLNEDGMLSPSNSSKPAEYTIKYLRLNRNQLIKLRTVRRLLDLWKEDLINLKSEAQKRVEYYEDKLKDFEMYTNTRKLEGKDLIMHKICIKQFEILYLSSQHYLDFINDQLNRLNLIIDNRIGNDEHFI